MQYLWGQELGYSQVKEELEGPVRHWHTALSPSQVLGEGPCPSSAVVVFLGCPQIAGTHRRLHPSHQPRLAGCPLSPHGHGSMDVPVHPNAEPVPSPFPGLGKCHQPFIRPTVTTVHFSKGHPSPPNRGDLQGCVQPQQLGVAPTERCSARATVTGGSRGISLEGSYRGGGPVPVATAGLGPASGRSSSARRAL